MPGEFDSADTVSIQSTDDRSLIAWPYTYVSAGDWRDRRIADLERQIEELKRLLERQRVEYHPANSWVCDGRCDRCSLSACPKLSYAAPVDNLPRLFSALYSLSDEALRLSGD